MQAVVLTGFTGADGVRVDDVPEPQAEGGQLLVDVAAAALGPWDPGTAQGLFAGAGGATDFPQILGWDFAGTVAAAPADGGFAVGQAVYGFSPQPWSRIGAFAERIAVPAELVAPAPEGVDPVDAATLPVSALTARLLLDTAGAAQGQSVLVIGAAGAVGGLAVQLAAQRGLVVLGSAAAADADRLRELGAVQAVDRDGDVAGQVRDRVPDGVDVVVDLVGGPAAAAAMAAVHDDGRFVSAIPGDPPSADRGVTVDQVQVNPDSAALAEIARLVAAGTIRPVPVVDRVPLEEAPAAFARQAAGGVKGKLVLVLS